MYAKHINDCFHISEIPPSGRSLCNWRTIIFILPFILLAPSIGNCKGDNTYDIVPVTLFIQRVGNVEMPIVIQEQEAYLPIKEMFDFLKIKNTISSDLQSITGFFIDPQSIYQIDKKQNQITYKGKIFDIKPTDLILIESELYLKPQYFGEIFGLECTFNFRGLSVMLSTTLELPAIREMKQEQMRQNISKYKGEKKADTTIRKKFSLFHVGMADWSVFTQQKDENSITRLSLALGAFIAGGETDMYLNYVTNQTFSINDQTYRWRYVNNNNNALRQVSIGKMFSQSTSSIFSTITGIQLSNIRTTTRNRSFGTYRITDKTEPEWIVELYLNNVLIDYTKADALGFYTFEVPLTYGNTPMKLRFYGPWGEERIIEQFITIPFTCLPLHELEYYVNAGIVNDDAKSRFSRLSVNYGLTKRITIGAGMEYLSSLSSGQNMPFFNTSIRVGSNVIFSGEHTYGVRTKGVLNYRTNSGFQGELTYIKYDKNQTAIRTSYLEERRFTLSKPFRGKKFGIYSSLSLANVIAPQSSFTNIDFLLSGSFMGVGTSIKTIGTYSRSTKSVNTTFSFNFRSRSAIRIIPQIRYEYTQKNFSMLRCEIEKNIFKRGFLNLSYERNMIAKTNIATLGFRYNFSFVQTSTNIIQINKNTTMTQSARGSIMYDDQTNAFLFNDQNNVGKGALTVLPFMDLNCNGRRDPNEPKNLTLKFNDRTIHDSPDSVIRVTGIEANTNFLVDLDQGSLNNIAYKILKPTVDIVIEPNHFMPIEVPIAVVGESSGTVYLKDSALQKGLGRIIVCFYKNDTVLVGRAVSESDGFFNFLGFPPGSYTAKIDPSQLNKLQMTAKPSVIPFKILPNKNGDVVDGLEFILRPMQESTPNSVPKANKKDSIVGDNNQPAKTDSLISKVIPAKEVKKFIKTIEEIKNKINMAAKRIFFETAKATLLKQSFSPLNEIVKILKENEFIKLDIEGHTDDIGSISYNELLSQRRANAVMDYLIKEGINKNRLSAKGYGELKPIASNKTAAGRAQNRRAVMNILQ